MGPATRIVRPTAADVSAIPRQVKPEQQQTPTLVGSIVERSIPSSSRRPQRRRPRPTSRGFPSLDRPVGSLISSAARGGGKTGASKNGTVNKDDDEEERKDNNGNVQDIYELSKQDAKRMLAGMSSEEIKQEQQELKSMLSPEMISFLKSRKKTASKITPKLVQKQQEVFTPVSTGLDSEGNSAPKDAAHSQKKEEFAELVSSIQTEEALDHVAAIHGASLPESQVNGDDDEFSIACRLLRSNHARQTQWAVQTIAKHLEENQNGRAHIDQSNPSIQLLPVSLRCLLDMPPSGSSYPLLIANSLQALYRLVQICVPPDHYVDISKDSTDNAPTGMHPADVHVYWYGDDAVPTRPLSSLYASSQTIKPIETEATSGQPAAYSTQASSTSAEKDARSFFKDPLWTLLSQMRLLARLAELLSRKNDMPWTEESLIPMCGILTTMSLRSRGAASAIANLMVPLLVPLTIGREEMVPSLMRAGLMFLTILARSSRAAAISVATNAGLEGVLPLLVLSSSSSNDKVGLARQAVVLWRTLLRYGLAVQAISTMVSLANPMIASAGQENDGHKVYLSNDLISCCTIALELSRVIFNKSPQEVSTSKIASAEQVEALTLVPQVLSSSVDIVIPQLKEAVQSNLTGVLQYTCIAARCSFLAAWWNLCAAYPSGSSSQNGEVKYDDLADPDHRSYLSTVMGMSAQGGILEQAVRQTFQTEGSSAQDLLLLEASASSLVKAVVGSLAALEPMLPNDHSTFQLAWESVQSCVLTLLPELCCQTVGSDECVRLGWVHGSRSAVAKVLCRGITDGLISSKGEVDLVRSFVFSLIGSLTLGEESIAAILFSQDTLFRTPVDTTPAPESPLSSLFLQELCGTDRARKQLDHSFKLHHGYGITAENGWGGLALDSLWSDVELPPSGEKELSASLLPMGELWLFQILSGDSSQSPNEISTLSRTISVLSSALCLIQHMEESQETSFSQSVPLGGKLYYLMNVCLHSEGILRDDRLSNSMSSLLIRYSAALDVQVDSLDFAKVCLRHSDPSKATTMATVRQNIPDAESTTLLDAFDNGNRQTAGGLSKHHVDALEAFVDDMIATYGDYGATFDFCTQGVRMVLTCLLPDNLRRKALLSLKNVIHTLSIPDEDSASWHSTLLACVSETCPSAELLHAVVDVLAATDSSSSPRRLDTGFALSFLYLLLVDGLAHRVTEASGTTAAALSPMSKRWTKLNPAHVKQIVETTRSFLNSPTQKKHELVQLVVDATSRPVDLESSRLNRVQVDELLSSLLTHGQQDG